MVDTRDSKSIKIPFYFLVLCSSCPVFSPVKVCFDYVTSLERRYFPDNFASHETLDLDIEFKSRC